jgi:hypothetical protein
MFWSIFTQSVLFIGAVVVIGGVVGGLTRSS